MPALVLMYHDLSYDMEGIPSGHAPYVLHPSAFRMQMRSVTASEIPVLAVTEWAEGPRPPRAIVLTFDDGHVSNHDLALPILLELQLRATFFVTAGMIASGSTMSWAQIRALHKAGMVIGSHTLTHRPPSTLNDDELRYELRESKRILEDGIGVAVTSVSSPTGFFNPRMRAIAQEVGYRTLCFGRAGLAADNGDPFLLHRVAVKRKMGQGEFEALLRFDGGIVRRLRLQQLLCELARNTLGPTAYLRLRRCLIGGHCI